MNAPDLINECRAHGLQVYIADGGLKVNGTEDAIRQYVPLLKSHKAEIERYLLERSLCQFCFDTISTEVESGCSDPMLTRINNMAWEFMQSDGMEFSDAIMTSAEIALTCPVAVCEAAYVDARMLFEKLTINFKKD